MNARVAAVAVLALSAGAALAVSPAEIAPGATELGDEEGRLGHLVAMSEAAGNAVSRMQSTWALLPPPEPGAKPCDDTIRLQLGWRTERFGAAWREAVQATRVQAGRVRALRVSPTAAPLLDDAWSARLDHLLELTEEQRRAWIESSAWELAYVRPWLSGCAYVTPAAHPGLSSRQVLARQDLDVPTAVLAMGDGFVCPQRTRADDGVVFVDGGRACWAPDTTCACDPAPVAAGAVLGPPVDELPTVEPAPEQTPAAAVGTPPKTTKNPTKKKNPTLEKGPSPL